MDDPSQLGQNIAREIVPGTTWMDKLDPAQLIQLLQQLIGGAGQGQPKWAEGGKPTDLGGSALKDQMMKQQIGQLSAPGGMGY